LYNRNGLVDEENSLSNRNWACKTKRWAHRQRYGRAADRREIRQTFLCAKYRLSLRDAPLPCGSDSSTMKGTQVTMLESTARLRELPDRYKLFLERGGFWFYSCVRQNCPYIEHSLILSVHRSTTNHSGKLS
jgi:hypothetical protein